MELYPPNIHGEGEGSIKLPFGETKYWIVGPENGKKVMNVMGSSTRETADNLLKVVLIHGLSIPSVIWHDVAKILAKNGFRVLLYGSSCFAIIGLVKYISTSRRSLRKRI